MKSTTPALEALLAGGQFVASNVFTLTLYDGSIYRYCGGDTDITFGGNTYPAPGMTGALWSLEGEEIEAEWTLGTQAQTFQATVAPRSALLLNSIPFITAARYGVLDGSTIRWDLAVGSAFGNPTVTTALVYMFSGRIVDVTLSDLTVEINANSAAELLDQQLPRNLFTPGCMWTLYDAGCSLNAASFGTNATIASGSTTSTLLVSGASGQATGRFDQGKVRINNGVNAGVSRAVRKWTNPSTCVIFPPLPQTPNVGDSITLFPGCDRLATTCQTKFNNYANFRGFPNIPVPETAV